MAEGRFSERDQQIVVFDVADESYGVEIGAVQEIIRTPAITTVPHAPHYVDGVINLRGRIIPVINLRARFGLPPAERDRNSRVVVLHIAGNTVGASVDAVSEVLRLPLSAVEAPNATLVGEEPPYVRAVATLEERLIVLLDLERVLEAPNLEDPAA